MNYDPSPSLFVGDLSWGLIVSFLVLLALPITIAVVAFVLTRRRHGDHVQHAATPPDPAVPAASNQGTLIAMLSAIALGIAVIVGLLVVSFQRQTVVQEESRLQVARKLAQQDALAEAKDELARLADTKLEEKFAEGDVVLPSEPTEAESVVGAKQVDPPLPKWITDPEPSKRDCEYLVLTSGLYATKDEALDDVMKQAVINVKRNFFHYHRDSPNWALANADVLHHAVRRQYTQVVEHDFGKFKGKMYRQYLLLEISPAVRDAFYPIWRNQVSRQRLALLGAGVGGAIWFVLFGHLCLRMRSLKDRSQRWTLQAAMAGLAVVGLVLMWGMLLLKGAAGLF